MESFIKESQLTQFIQNNKTLQLEYLKKSTDYIDIALQIYNAKLI